MAMKSSVAMSSPILIPHPHSSVMVGDRAVERFRSSSALEDDETTTTASNLSNRSHRSHRWITCTTSAAASRGPSANTIMRVVHSKASSSGRAYFEEEHCVLMDKMQNPDTVSLQEVIDIVIENEWNADAITFLMRSPSTHHTWKPPKLLVNDARREIMNLAHVFPHIDLSLVTLRDITHVLYKHGWADDLRRNNIGFIPLDTTIINDF